MGLVRSRFAFARHMFSRLWALVAVAFAVVSALTWVRDEWADVLPPSIVKGLKMPNILPDWPWYCWAIASLMTLLIIGFEAAYREVRGLQLRIAGEADAKSTSFPKIGSREALKDLRTKTAWAYKTYA